MSDIYNEKICASVDSGLPSQTGKNGKFLTTDGAAASWDTPSGGSWPILTSKPEVTVGDAGFGSSSNDLAGALDALVAAGNPEKTLIVPPGAIVGGTKTVPSNVTIRFARGALLTSGTLTINGELQAGQYNILNGGTLVISETCRNQYVLPEWWGAVPVNTVDSQPGLQACINALPLTREYPIVLSGRYTVYSTIILKTCTRFVSAYGSQENMWTTPTGPGIGTNSSHAIAGPMITDNGANAQRNLFKNVALIGSFATTPLLMTGYSESPVVDGCYVYGGTDPTKFAIDFNGNGAHMSTVRNTRIISNGNGAYRGCADSYIGPNVQMVGSALNTGLKYYGEELCGNIKIWGFDIGVQASGNTQQFNGVQIAQCNTPISCDNGVKLVGTNVSLHAYIECLKLNNSQVQLSKSNFDYPKRGNITGAHAFFTAPSTITLVGTTWGGNFIYPNQTFKITGATNGANAGWFKLLSLNSTTEAVVDDTALISEGSAGAPVTVTIEFVEPVGINDDGWSIGEISQCNFIDDIPAHVNEGHRAVKYGFRTATEYPRRNAIFYHDNLGLDLPRNFVDRRYLPTNIMWKSTLGNNQGTFKRKRPDGTTAGNMYQELTLTRADGGNFLTDGAVVGDWVYVSTTGTDTYYAWLKIKAVSGDGLALTFYPAPYNMTTNPDFSLGTGVYTVEKLLLPWLTGKVAASAATNLNSISMGNEGQKKSLAVIGPNLTVKKLYDPRYASNYNGTTHTSIVGVTNPIVYQATPAVNNAILLCTKSKICGFQQSIATPVTNLTSVVEYWDQTAASWQPVLNLTAEPFKDAGVKMIYFTLPETASMNGIYSSGYSGLLGRDLTFNVRIRVSAIGTDPNFPTAGSGTFNAPLQVSSFRMERDFPIIPLDIGETATLNMVNLDGIWSEQSSSISNAPETTYGLAGEALTAYDLCYLKSDGKYWKASNGAVGTMPGTAIVTTTTSTTGTFITRGKITNAGWAWATVGGFVYAGTGGALTQTLPSGSGNQVQIVGIALSATQIDFDPQLVLLEVA